MRRRRLLAAMAAAGTAGAAGCLGGSAPESSDPGATATRTPFAGPGDVTLPVPRSELRTALPKDAIPAVVDPAFGADWTGLDAPEDATRPLLPDDSAVVGVERSGRARAYPLRVLNWHEVVNDDFGGPLLVTYCPLCGSAVVAERVVDGAPTVFGVSGKLWREDLVMYDRATGSLWSQLLATAIRGPRTGDRLSLLPSTLTAWGEWRERHPGTEVLLPPPRSNTVRGRDATHDYFADKYGYEGGQLVGYDYGDGGLYDRSLVVGVVHDGLARAYPYETVRREDVVNDAVAGLPVVVTVTPAGSMAAHVRRVEGTTLTFEPVDDRRMRAGGSTWDRATGRALDGPYQGVELKRANEKPPLFWVGWSNFHPDTEVYGPRQPD